VGRYLGHHEATITNAATIDENNTPPEIFVLREPPPTRRNYEAMPLRASALPSAVTCGSTGACSRQPHRFSVLDTRQWRSDQPCGDGSRTNCAGRLAPTQTMMGPSRRNAVDNLGTVKAR